MAEYLMKKLVLDAGREHEFVIDSAATHSEEVGNPLYPPAREMLLRHKVPCEGHRARQMTRQDYDRYDMILLMDSENRRCIRRIVPEDAENKIRMLLPRDVADPWYTGDFSATWDDLLEGCTRLLEQTGRSASIHN